MAVDDKIPPLDFSAFKKKRCGGTASTASNSVCPRRTGTFGSSSVGPFTVTSRIPIPPRTSKCQNKAHIPTQNVNVQGKVQLENTGNVNIDRMDVNIYPAVGNSQMPAPGVSIGGGMPGPASNPYDGPRSFPYDSKFIARTNRGGRNGYYLGGLATVTQQKKIYQICKTETTLSPDRKITLRGSDGFEQSFTDPGTMAAAIPGIEDQLEQGSRDRIKDVWDNWKDANSNRKFTTVSSLNIPIEQLGVSFLSDRFSIGLHVLVGASAYTEYTAQNNVQMTLTQSGLGTSSGGMTRGGNNLGTAGSEYGLTDYNYNSMTLTGGDTKYRLRAGINITATARLQDWLYADAGAEWNSDGITDIYEAFFGLRCPL